MEADVFASSAKLRDVKVAGLPELSLSPRDQARYVCSVHDTE